MPYPLWPSSPGPKLGWWPWSARGGQGIPSHPRQYLSPAPGSKVWPHRGALQRRMWPENKVRKRRRPTSCEESIPSLKKGREGLGRLWELSQVSQSRTSQTKTNQAERSKSPLKFTLKLHAPATTVSSKRSEENHMPVNVSHGTPLWKLPGKKTGKKTWWPQYLLPASSVNWLLTTWFKSQLHSD